jgi:hypothetical protein
MAIFGMEMFEYQHDGLVRQFGRGLCVEARGVLHNPRAVKSESGIVVLFGLSYR